MVPGRPRPTCPHGRPWVKGLVAHVSLYVDGPCMWMAMVTHCNPWHVGPEAVLGAWQGLSVHFLPYLSQHCDEVGGAVSILAVNGKGP